MENQHRLILSRDVLMNDKYPLGRLAFRQEGEVWNAYYKTKDDESFFLGSIAMALVIADEEIKKDFMSLMKNLVSNIIYWNFGEVSDWQEPQSAPEHERSGNA